MLDFVNNTDYPVTIPYENLELNGLLHVPQQMHGLVIFAHGSGSSRLSPRNQMIAKSLQQQQFATLLFDLLTAEEDEVDDQTREYRFDIALLAKRLVSVTNWLSDHPLFYSAPTGYFGASTGAAAALIAAAILNDKIKAVVSRGGRPDLAGDVLANVKAATLFIVGGEDHTVLQLNRKAFDDLHSTKKLSIVPNATHLFEEAGKLEIVSQLAEAWFKIYLV